MKWAKITNKIIKDIKTREIKIIYFAIIVSIACLVSLAFVIEKINFILQDKLGEVLGGDRVISSFQPISKKTKSLIRLNNIRSVHVSELLTMIVNGDNFSIAEVKAVEPAYPLKGVLKISDHLTGNIYETTKVPEIGTIWIDERLYNTLNLKIGQSVILGKQNLVVSKILHYQPDEQNLLALTPKALMNINDLETTGLLRPGSKVSYKLLLTGNEQELKLFDEDIKPKLPQLESVSDPRTSHPAIKRIIENTEIFIDLTILTNFFIALFAILVATRFFCKKRAKQVALLRCFGATSRNILKQFAISLSISGFLLSLIGIFLGGGCYFVLEHYLLSKIHITSLGVRVQPLMIGFIGSFLFLLFIIPYLSHLSMVSPMLILRKNIEPMKVKSLPILMLLFFILMFLILYLINNNELILFLILLFAILGIGLLYLIEDSFFIFQKISHYFNFAVSFGLKGLKRRGRENAIQVMILTFVFTFTLMIFFIQHDLLFIWKSGLSKKTPNYFAINLLAEEVPYFERGLKNFNIETDTFYPIIRGSLIKINQESIATDLNKTGRKGFRRALNLTYTMELPADNRLLSGEWFTKDDEGKPYVSIEKVVVDRLNLKMGDTVTFDIAGKTITATVKSIREAKWDNFKPNFYFIFPKGLLEEFPSTYIGSFFAEKSSIPGLIEVVKTFPSISLISTDNLFQQVSKIKHFMTFLISYLWGFTLLTSIILVIAISMASMDERLLEGEILHRLGASQKTIYLTYQIEMFILGGYAGFLASVLAQVSASWISSYYFKVSYDIRWIMFLIFPVMSGVFMMLLGRMSYRKKHSIQLRMQE